jgi:hypothetical protein
MKIGHYNSATCGNPKFVLGKLFSFLVQFAGMVRKLFNYLINCKYNTYA